MYGAVMHVEKDIISVHVMVKNEVHREIRGMHNIFEDNLLYATVRMY